MNTVLHLVSLINLLSLSYKFTSHASAFRTKQGKDSSCVTSTILNIVSRGRQKETAGNGLLFWLWYENRHFFFSLHPFHCCQRGSGERYVWKSLLSRFSDIPADGFPVSLAGILAGSHPTSIHLYSGLVFPVATLNYGCIPTSLGLAMVDQLWSRAMQSTFSPSSSYNHTFSNEV